MTADDNAPGHVEQDATASDHAQIYQAGRDQHITNITQAPSRRPQALAALPAAPEHLVGRQAKVDELLAALTPESPTTGSATVVVSAVAGLAGIGKTALALHTAHHAAEQGLFPGGVLYVTLRGYDPAGPVTAQRALGILLRQLGIRDEDLPGEVEELAALYQSELARRTQEAGPVLILADDASSPTQLTSLVPAQRVHRLLVTSRNTLTSPTFRARLLRVEELEPAAAAELIRTAVALVLPDDRRSVAEPEALAEVVALCGRLPLALQIAAALLTSDPGLPLAVLAEDLADTLNALQFHDDDGGGGQSLAVRAAFDLSYRRLAPEAARVFRLLGLCVGPDVATDSAAALTDQPVRETRRTLATIANSSLITEEPLGSGRWRMHDLIRLYATELADPDSGESQAALARLLRHYTELAEAANNHLKALPGDQAPVHFDDRGQALAWLDAEHPTLVATTISAAVAARQPATSVALALNLNRFLCQRRHFDDAITIAEHALGLCRDLDNRHGEGEALSNLGLALREVRRFDDAINAHNQALTIFSNLGDHPGAGQALTNLGLALREVRRFDDAINAQLDAAAISTALGDQQGRGAALNNLGNALQEVHRFESAIKAHSEAAKIFADLGDRHSAGGALTNLGLALQQVRRFDEAIKAHTNAAEIFADLGYGEGGALNNLGLALQQVRRFDDAIKAHTNAAEIFADLGERHRAGAALNNLGIALQQVRRFDQAIDACTQALAIFTDLDDRHNKGRALSNLGAALNMVRRFDEAIDAHTQAAAIFADLGDYPGAGGALNNLGLALQQVRRFDDAINAHTHAVAIFAGLGDRHGEEWSMRRLADVVAAAGRAGGQ